MAKSKPKTLTLTRHPASALFPDNDEATFARLVADIRDNGLQTKILCTPNNEVIDGWHRTQALQQLGIAITEQHVTRTDEEPTAAALRIQFGRRNLTSEQSAVILLRAGHAANIVSARCSLSSDKVAKLQRVIGDRPDIADQLLKGTIKSIGRAYVQAFGLEPVPAPIRNARPSNDVAPSTPVRDHVAPKPNRAKLMRAAAPSESSDGQAPDHLVIPDTQAKPGVPLVHMKWIAMYAAQKRPQRIIHLGDHFDLPSLSSYDKGTKRAEGRRLSADIAAGALALRIFNDTLAQHAPDYAPEKHMLTGNHEIRLQRHIDASPELDGALSMSDLRREEFGWTVHDFLEMSEFEGVWYSHYFCHNAHGRVVQSKRGQPSAREQLKRIGCVSCVAGHAQSLDVHYQSIPATGGIQTGIIAGSCYLHEEEYLTGQGEDYWRGILMLNNVVGGEFALWSIGLDWLCRRFEGKSLKEFLATAKDSELMIANV